MKYINKYWKFTFKKLLVLPLFVSYIGKLHMVFTTLNVP